jgi:hypothetical protein
VVRASVTVVELTVTVVEDPLTMVTGSLTVVRDSLTVVELAVTVVEGSLTMVTGSLTVVRDSITVVELTMVTGFKIYSMVNGIPANSSTDRAIPAASAIRSTISFREAGLGCRFEDEVRHGTHAPAADVVAVLVGAGKGTSFSGGGSGLN